MNSATRALSISLSQDDLRCLAAAEGYVELGMYKRPWPSCNKRVRSVINFHSRKRSSSVSAPALANGDRSRRQSQRVDG